MKKKIFLGAAIVLVLIAAGLAGFFLYATHQVKGRFFESNGVSIHYTDQGKGVPVVLIHGYSANKDLNWRIPGVLKELARDHRVIAMDVRGHGLSGKPHDPGKYGLELVNDVVRLMDHLKIEKAHILGYSMGAMITLKLLARHPERFLTAMPCGIKYIRPDAPDAHILENICKRYESFTGPGAYLRALARGNFSQCLESIAIRCVNDVGALSALAKSGPLLTLADTDLKNNTVPALTVIGDQDFLFDGFEDVKNSVGAIQCVVIPGANHTTAIFRPEFIQAIKAFLAK